jgi:hypothetical protein
MLVNKEMYIIFNSKLLVHYNINKFDLEQMLFLVLYASKIFKCTCLQIVLVCTFFLRLA